MGVGALNALIELLRTYPINSSETDQFNQILKEGLRVRNNFKSLIQSTCLIYWTFHIFFAVVYIFLRIKSNSWKGIEEYMKRKYVTISQFAFFILQKTYAVQGLKYRAVTSDYLFWNVKDLRKRWNDTSQFSSHKWSRITLRKCIRLTKVNSVNLIWLHRTKRLGLKHHHCL